MRTRSRRTSMPARRNPERLSVRYIHKISPSDKDVGPDVVLSDGAFSNSKTLGKALREAKVLASGAIVRSFRAEGDKVIVFPILPGSTTYWHSIVLTHEGREEPMRRNPTVGTPHVPVISLDFLAKIVGETPWEKLEDQVYEAASEGRYENEKYYRKQAERDDEEIDEAELEKKLEEAEQDAITEEYKEWLSNVETPAENLFLEYDLDLVAQQPDTSVYEYAPRTSWEKSANLLRELVNGVGYFHFNTLEEFLDSGPYAPEEAVVNHIGWLSDHYKVYGGRPARRR